MQMLESFSQLNRSSRFRPGTENPAWKGGRTLTKKGYVRITAGVHRHKLEHRVVIETLPGPLALNRPLREGEEVHHIDFKRDHNCPENLLLLDEAIHDYFSIRHAKHMRKFFRKGQ